MKRILFLFLILNMVALADLSAQPYLVSGHVVDASNGKPLEFATVIHPESRQGTMVDADGHFSLGRLPGGRITLEIRYFGYATQPLTLFLTRDTSGVVVRMLPQSLELKEVSVTANKSKSDASTSYRIDRTALDHNQVVNVSDVMALLPGGKSQGDLSLLSDERVALRSEGGSEMGNPAFGTAIVVDGMRIGNNADMNETDGASTRNIPTGDIESVEIITGVASVEHGDLSNGMVRVRTRRGKTPLTIDITAKPHTKLIAVGKGLNLGRQHHGGILNLSYEWARSYKSLTSPYTSYTRNGLTLRYSQQFLKQHGMPLFLYADLKGNLGGLDSKADPDAFAENYQKQKDYALRAQVQLDWQPKKAWLTDLNLTLNGSIENKEQKLNSNKSSASSLPYVHTPEAGYHIADGQQIIMGPVGYWYELAITDSKPVNAGAHLKAKWDQVWNEPFGRKGIEAANHIKAGADYTLSGNEGRGLYYDDLKLATSHWREARYDTLPYMHNIGLYTEDQLQMPLGKRFGDLQITLGVREDLTHVKGSDYGTVSSFSPRGTLRWNISDHLSVTAGAGKAVKLPSMQVLFPPTSYADWMTFASGSDAGGNAVYAYFSRPSRAICNSRLRWQYSVQQEVGVEARLKGHKMSLTYFRNQTYRPYVSTTVYTPFSYEYTPPVANADQYTYTVDPATGKITATSTDGSGTRQVLSSETIRRFMSNTKWINGSSSVRQGVEWVIDFARIRQLNTQIRLDGNYYHYKGVENSLMAYCPTSTTQSDGQPYGYIGYFAGGSSVANGSLKQEVNTNVTVTTHIPVVKLIVSLRFECTFYEMSQRLNDRRISGFMGYHSAVLPLYYSTWDDPDTRLVYPSASELQAMAGTDPARYSDLIKLVRTSPTDYFFTADRISPYFSSNLNVTKEIGRHVSLSFYATNFWNNTARYHSSATDRRISLFASSKIPSFYYGLTLKVKL